MSVEKFIELYESRTKKSREIYAKAREILPGGVSGSAAFLAPHPIYIDKAQGGKFVDIDGNEYIDFHLGGGPNLLGHSPGVVMEAVKKQLDRGTVYTMFQQTGIDLAKKIREYMPYLEMLRFVNTGSEATQSAIRVARSWTKKDKIAKIEGGYNGQHDYVLVSGISSRVAGTPERPEPAPDFAGIPKFVIDNTCVLPYNDIQGSLAIIKENADELAAVIIEPLSAYGIGGVMAKKEYLEALRKITEEENILLIYDEVVTAFRLGGMGGAAKHFGVIPDLNCFGKPIGGGFPIGCFGGRRDIMERTCNPQADPEYKIFQSGTFTGNPVAMTAGLALLTELEKKDFSYINNLGEKIRSGLRKIADEQGHKIQVVGEACLFFPHFAIHSINNNRDKINADLDKQREFCLGLVANGIYLPPVHQGQLCFSHTEEDAEELLNVAEKVMKEMNE